MLDDRAEPGRDPDRLDGGIMPAIPSMPPERECDGCFLDADGKIHPSGTPLESMDPVLPNNGAPVIDRVVQINGIMTDARRHLGDMQALANSGAAVIGIHNSTFGLAADISEYFKDRFGKTPSKTVLSLKALVSEAIEKGEALHLVGHSQGALMIARALREIHQELSRKGAGPQEIEAKLSALKIETYGGGSGHYVDGPRYVHVDNHFDPVPQFLGLGRLASVVNQKQYAGKGAVIISISEINTRWGEIFMPKPEDKGPFLIDKLVHGPRSIYFPRRVPFDVARGEGEVRRPL